jgi:5-formyltetrahydrofolate cyclo-ligase
VPQPIQAQKQALRSLLRQQRAHRAPPPGSPDAAAQWTAVAELVDAELRAHRARSVALYAARGDEFDPAGIGERARARGCKLCYPRVARRDPPTLTFHTCQPEELTRSGFGIREPSAATPSPPAIDAFIVPGLGFDRRGARLGYGQGFYDATLREQPVALRIAVGYDFQVLSAIPMDAQDEPVDLVVTPSGRWRTGARPLPVPPVKEELL